MTRLFHVNYNNGTLAHCFSQMTALKGVFNAVAINVVLTQDRIIYKQKYVIL